MCKIRKVESKDTIKANWDPNLGLKCFDYTENKNFDIKKKNSIFFFHDTENWISQNR